MRNDESRTARSFITHHSSFIIIHHFTPVRFGAHEPFEPLAVVLVQEAREGEREAYLLDAVDDRAPERYLPAARQPQFEPHHLPHLDEVFREYEAAVVAEVCDGRLARGPLALPTRMQVDLVAPGPPA